MSNEFTCRCDEGMPIPPTSAESPHSPHSPHSPPSSPLLRLKDPSSFDVEQLTIYDTGYTNAEVCTSITPTCGICLEDVDTTMPGTIEYNDARDCGFLVDLGSGISHIDMANLTTAPGMKIGTWSMGSEVAHGSSVSFQVIF